MEYRITFDSGTGKDKNIFASELQRSVSEACPDAKFVREREHSGSMDMGTILTILSTGGGVAIARGIATWLAHRQQATITVTADGKIVATGVTSRDAVKLANLHNGNSGQA